MICGRYFSYLILFHLIEELHNLLDRMLLHLLDQKSQSVLPKNNNILITFKLLNIENVFFIYLKFSSCKNC